MIAISKVSRSRRGGWQLVELMMVVTAVGMISVAAARVMTGLMRIESRCGQSLEDAALVQRLSEEWRRDLHTASDVKLSDDGNSVSIQTLDGRAVTYRIDGTVLHRDEPGERDVKKRDEYSADSRRWRFEVAPKQRLASIVRETSPRQPMGTGQNVSPAQVERIDGAWGLAGGRL